MFTADNLRQIFLSHSEGIQPAPRDALRQYAQHTVLQLQNMLHSAEHADGVNIRLRRILQPDLPLRR